MDDLTREFPLSEVHESNRRGRHRKSRSLSRGAFWGILAVTVSMVLSGAFLVGWSIYQPYAHEGATQNAQNALEKQWEDQGPDVIVDPTKPTPKPTKKPPSGPGYTPVAKLSIPSLGLTWYVINGVTLADLRYAPGHYPSSAMPGKAGNFAIAGHRERGMFWDLDRVKAGQQVIVETKTTRFTYTVIINKITNPSATQEVSSVPPGFTKGDKILTLTTCDPKWDNYHRMIVHAKLTGTQSL